jgi:glycerate dehydrogenase
MQIVVLDGYTTNPGDQSWEPLRALGELTVYDRTPEDQIRDRAEGAEILLTNKTPIRAELLDGLEAVEFVSLLATGYDNVDVTAARRFGIPVSNIPEYASACVAEHTIGLMLELTHRVGEHGRAVERGEWSEGPDFTFWTTQIRELAGGTLGIVGFGRIGRRVGRAASALGMRVIGSTHRSDPSPAFESFEPVENEELFRRADIVSLHCPLTAETEGLVDADALEAMKDDAFLVNTSRGEVVVGSDLREALEATAADDEADVLAGAAVDVLSEEPPGPEHPLVGAPRCIVTPHNAWASVEARGRLIDEAAANVQAYLQGDPIHVVNDES